MRPQRGPREPPAAPPSPGPSGALSRARAAGVRGWAQAIVSRLTAAALSAAAPLAAAAHPGTDPSGLFEEPEPPPPELEPPPPAPPSAAPIPPVDARRAPPLRLHHQARAATATIVVFEAGELRPAALTELRAFLHDPRTGVDRPIHWRLATLLVAVQARFPAHQLVVVSGVRDGRGGHRPANHGRGRALDFRVEGVPNRVLFDMLRASFADVGVGYYPNSTFVHLDVRERATVWVDYSGPGETPCYDLRPLAALRDGTAERLSYEQAVAAGCRGGPSR